jgi:DNA-binding NtrC family response regulator
MMSTATWEAQELDMVNMPASNDQPHDAAEQLPSANTVATLRELTLQLCHQVHSLGEVQTLNLDGGLDFYDEVSRFEIELIRRALLRTAGNQRRAARLLNLKVTTLNSKIKYYNINPAGFANGYLPAETKESEIRRQA